MKKPKTDTKEAQAKREHLRIMHTLDRAESVLLSTSVVLSDIKERLYDIDPDTLSHYLEVLEGNIGDAHETVFWTLHEMKEKP
jgi:hypothetical protein